MLGGTRFNDRKEIRDIVAYLHDIKNGMKPEYGKQFI
jgi:superfamily I DNA/RNA helicase